MAYKWSKALNERVGKEFTESRAVKQSVFLQWFYLFFMTLARLKERWAVKVPSWSSRTETTLFIKSTVKATVFK